MDADVGMEAHTDAGPQTSCQVAMWQSADKAHEEHMIYCSQTTFRDVTPVWKVMPGEVTLQELNLISKLFHWDVIRTSEKSRLKCSVSKNLFSRLIFKFVSVFGFRVQDFFSRWGR